MNKHNLKQIERMNQRGGRLLSIVDLMEAGTITAEAAGFCLAALHEGAGIFTGAVPGGAGKTTLLASLLALLPPEEKIITAADRRAIVKAASAAAARPVCLLAHEVGAGSWYAYIWGETARAFFDAGRAGARLVTTLHADTPAQVTGVLDQAGIDTGTPPTELQLFIEKLPNAQRRVTSVCFDFFGEMKTVLRRDAAADRLALALRREEIEEKAARRLDCDPEGFSQRWKRCTQALLRLQEDGIREFRAVAREYAALAGDAPPMEKETGSS